MAWFTDFFRSFRGGDDAHFEADDVDSELEKAIEHDIMESIPRQILAVARVQAIVETEVRRLSTERALLETEIRTRLEKLRQCNVALSALSPANAVLVADTEKGDVNRIPAVTPLALVSNADIDQCA